jgi:hypothetical protein
MHDDHHQPGRHWCRGAGRAAVHCPELVQREPRNSSPLPLHSPGVGAVEIESRRDQLADEADPRRLRLVNQVRQDVMDVPVGTQRWCLPLFWRQRIEIPDQGFSFGMDGIPDFTHSDLPRRHHSAAAVA